MPDVLVLVLWTVSALVAMSAALLMLGAVLADLEYLLQKGHDGVNRVQAFENVRTHLTRVVIAVLFLAIGLLALVQAPYRGEISRWLLILAAMLIAVGSVVDWLDRRKKVLLIMREEEKATR
jgi:hypothetical protein